MRVVFLITRQFQQQDEERKQQRQKQRSSKKRQKSLRKLKFTYNEEKEYAVIDEEIESGE